MAKSGWKAFFKGYDGLLLRYDNKNQSMMEKYDMIKPSIQNVAVFSKESKAVDWKAFLRETVHGKHS